MEERISERDEFGRRLKMRWLLLRWIWSNSWSAVHDGSP